MPTVVSERQEFDQLLTEKEWEETGSWESEARGSGDAIDAGGVGANDKWGESRKEPMVDRQERGEARGSGDAGSVIDAPITVDRETVAAHGECARLELGVMDVGCDMGVMGVWRANVICNGMPTAALPAAEGWWCWG